MRSKKRWLATGLCLVAFLSCRGGGPTSPGPDSVVVARVGDDAITLEAVDAHILALPVSQRPGTGEDLGPWFEEQVRQVAVEMRLRAEAEAAALQASEELVEARADAESLLTVQLCLAKLHPELERVDEQDVRAAFEARSDSLRVPERRAAFHVFLRREAGLDDAALRSRIESLRDRVLAGESFSRLAEQFSESESRHRQGSFGWVQRGQLPDDLEQVVFGLEEGVPSDPVATHDGFHLFYVDHVLPEHQLEYDEARPLLEKGLLAERRDAALVAMEKEAAVPPDALLLDRDAFRQLAEAGDPSAVVLRVGESEISLGELRRRVHTLASRQPAGAQRRTPAELIWPTLDDLRRRLLLAGHCRALGAVAADQLQARLETWQERALLDVQRHRRMLEVAGRDENRLRTFYQSNLGLFSKPLKWHLRRLRVPMTSDRSTVMARLEKAAREGAELEALQAELGGEIDDLGLLGMAETQRIDGRLPALVSPLAVGALAAPYRAAESLDVVELVERQEAEPIPFDEVRSQVAAQVVEKYTREIYEQLTAEIFAEHALRLDPAGMAKLREAGLPQEDISVEQLERLLDEL